jgi:hypothetical protein
MPLKFDPILGVVREADSGGSTPVDNVLTSTSTTNALSAAQGKALKDTADALAAAVAAKATLSALRADAIVSTVGSASGAIDTSKQNNPRSVTAATTLTFSGAPAAADTYFGSVVRNTSGSDVVITIPSSFSMRQQNTITSFTLPAGARADLTWRWDGTAYLLYGETVRDPFQVVFALIGTAAAREYPVILDNARPFRVTSVVSKCASGADTATVRIGGVPLGGAVNAVSPTKQTQAHTSANSAALAADVTVSFAGGAVDPQVTLKGYFT